MSCTYDELHLWWNSHVFTSISMQLLNLIKLLTPSGWSTLGKNSPLYLKEKLKIKETELLILIHENNLFINIYQQFGWQPLSRSPPSLNVKRQGKIITKQDWNSNLNVVSVTSETTDLKKIVTVTFGPWCGGTHLLFCKYFTDHTSHRGILVRV